MKNIPLPGPPPEEPASSEEAISFVQGLHKRRGDEKALREYVNGFRRGRRQRIARRIMMDIMKAPQGDMAANSSTEKSGRAATARLRARSGPARRRRPTREP
jgi:hypothetical protein